MVGTHIILVYCRFCSDFMYSVLRFACKTLNEEGIIIATDWAQFNTAKQMSMLLKDLGTFVTQNTMSTDLH